MGGGGVTRAVSLLTTGRGSTACQGCLWRAELSRPAAPGRPVSAASSASTAIAVLLMVVLPHPLSRSLVKTVADSPHPPLGVASEALRPVRQELQELQALVLLCWLYCALCPINGSPAVT